MAAEFEWIKRIGAGHFSEVWLARDTGLNTCRAVKLIPRGKIPDPNNFFREAQILKLAEHPNIVKIEETGYMPDGRIYVAMEYHPKGSMEDEARGASVDLTRAKRIMVDVLRGLEHAHSKHIIHCDIKPANILIGSANEGILSDFGLAVPAGVNLKTLGVKDYAYIAHLAPECHSSRKFTVASDVYAAGVTLYRLINGDRYLPSLTPEDIMAASATGKFPDRNKYRDFVTRPLRVIVNRAIRVKPGKRFTTVSQMRHSLEQVVIKMNWNETFIPDGIRWSCSWDNNCYEVTRRGNSTTGWFVEVKKGRSIRSLRRVTRLCQKGLSKSAAEKHTRKILQSYVMGKRA